MRDPNFTPREAETHRKIFVEGASLVPLPRALNFLPLFVRDAILTSMDWKNVPVYRIFGKLYCFNTDLARELQRKGRSAR